MAALIVAIVVLVAVAGGAGLMYDTWRQGHAAERQRDQARLRLIEGQMATLQAALRIQVAEHTAHQRMRATVIRPDSAEHGEASQPWLS
jgi:cytochrome c-type biogenesis protein CcmH/NrfG